MFTVSRSSAGALCQGPGPLLPLFHSPQVPIVTHKSLDREMMVIFVKNISKQTGEKATGRGNFFSLVVSNRHDGSLKFLRFKFK